MGAAKYIADSHPSKKAQHNESEAHEDWMGLHTRTRSELEVSVNLVWCGVLLLFFGCFFPFCQAWKVQLICRELFSCIYIDHHPPREFTFCFSFFRLLALFLPVFSYIGSTSNHNSAHTNPLLTNPFLNQYQNDYQYIYIYIFWCCGGLRLMAK